MKLPSKTITKESVLAYFEALRKGDFKSWASWALIRRGEDQAPMWFDHSVWNEEQVKYWEHHKGGDRDTRKEGALPRWDVVLKSRRIGMTTFACLQDLFYALRWEGRDVMFVAQDESTRAEGLEIIRLAHDALLELGKKIGIPLAPDREEDNSRIIKFSTGSRILSEVAKATAASAQKAGRGKTVSRLHCTETAFWSYPDQTMISLLEASSKAKEIIIESTPAGSTGWFYDLVNRATPWKPGIKNPGPQSKWRLHFFPWYEHKDYRVKELPVHWDPTPQNRWEKEAVEYHGVDDHQLAWWRAKVEDHGIMKIIQEYPSDMITCFRASGASFFSEDDFARLSHAVTPPIEWRDMWGMPVAIWEKLLPNSRYIIGADCSYGRGQDSSAFCIICCDGGRIVATGASPDIDTSTYARILAQLGREWNGAMLAVEHQASGHAVINDLVSKEGYHNIFKHRDKDYLGWNTTVTTRPQMFYLIQSWVAEGKAIPDSALIGELKSIQVKSGRPEAPKGCHDDRVMAFAIALSVWQEAPPLMSTGYISVHKTDASQIVSSTKGFGVKGMGRRGKGWM